MAVCNLDGLPSEHSKRILSEVVDEENYSTCLATIHPGPEKGENRLGEIIKIEISGLKKDNTQNSTHLVLKLPPTDDAMRQFAPVNRLFVKEGYAYKVLIPHFEKLQNEYNISNEVRLKFVKCYKSSSEEFREFLVMEDLAVQGFKMHDRLISFDLGHLEMSIKNMATIHAFSFVIKERDPKLFAEMASHASNSVDFGNSLQGLVEKSFSEAIRIMDDEVNAKKLERFSISVYDKFCQYVDPEFATPHNVICHGDSWSNNFLFRYEKNKPVEMRTLDWQMIRNASPVTDLAYLIFLSTSEDIRAKHFSNMLDLYYHTLRVRLSAMDHDIDKCFPEDVFKDHVKRILPYGLLFSLFALPITLSDRENAPDQVDMLRNSAAIKTESFSQACIERMRGVVRDFVKYKMI